MAKLTTRRARHIRFGIYDARRRVFPYWSAMGQITMAMPWDSATRRALLRQPRSEAYRLAFIRTSKGMPLPMPPRGPSGTSIP